MLAVHNSFKTDLKEKEGLVSQLQSDKATIANTQVKLE